MAHHLTPQDVVPALRSDLSINRPPIGAGAEVIKVTPSDSATPYTMRGFEFSIARMFNGKRTAKEVIANAERIGLPMDLQSLEGLVHQLEEHGLIADGKHPGVGQDLPIRRARASWSPEIRELYREALRDAREGDLDSARRACEALLDVAPGTFEAIALKEWVDNQQHAQNLGIPFQTLLHAAEEGWRADALADDYFDITVEEAPTAPVVVPRRPRPNLMPFAVMAAGLAVVAIALFVPLPRISLASARITPIAGQAVTPQREGVIDEVLVKEGENVARGEELVVFNTDDAQIRLAEARDELEQARAPLRDGLSKTEQGGPLAAELKRADDEMALAQSKLLEAQKAQAGMDFDESIRVVEEEFARAQAHREQARRALDSLLPAGAPEAMKLEAKVLEIEMLENQIQDPVVRAPDAGLVKNLNVQPGQQVVANTRLLEIEDVSQMKVVATVTPRVAKLARAGDPITVDLDGKSFRTVIDEVREYEVVATVANPEAKIQTGTYSVNLEFKPQSLWDTL
jgi:multidrug resistance efflux pump